MSDGYVAGQEEQYHEISRLSRRERNKLEMNKVRREETKKRTVLELARQARRDGGTHRAIVAVLF